MRLRVGNLVALLAALGIPPRDWFCGVHRTRKRAAADAGVRKPEGENPPRLICPR